MMNSLNNNTNSKDYTSFQDSELISFVQPGIYYESSQDKIIKMCEEVKELLLEKNRKYGDSALNPIKVFSKVDAIEALLVRIDDKLSRIKNSQTDEDEDVIYDLIGYLILLRVKQKEQNDKKQRGVS